VRCDIGQLKCKLRKVPDKLGSGDGDVAENTCREERDDECVCVGGGGGTVGGVEEFDGKEEVSELRDDPLLLLLPPVASPSLSEAMLPGMSREARSYCCLEDDDRRSDQRFRKEFRRRGALVLLRWSGTSWVLFMVACSLPPKQDPRENVMGVSRAISYLFVISPE